MDGIAQLQARVQSASSNGARAQALREMASVLARWGNFERSLECSRNAIEIAFNDEDLASADEARLAQVECHMFAKTFLSGLEIALDVAERCERRGEFRLAALAQAAAGVCEHQLGALDEATASMTRALDIAKQCEPESLSARDHCALGRKLAMAGMTDQAQGVLSKALELASASDHALRCQIFVDMAILDSERGHGHADSDSENVSERLSDALKLLQIGRSEAILAGSRYWQGNCALGLGHNLLTLGRYAESENAITEALEIAQSLGEPIQIAASRFHLARLHLEQCRYPEAIHQLTLVSAMVPELGSRSQFPTDAFRLLSEAYEKIGDLPSSLHSLRQHQRLHSEKVADASLQAVRAVRRHASRIAADAKDLAERLLQERAQLQVRSDALAIEAQTDALTGLLNRRGFESNINALALQRGSAEPLAAVVVIDVDRFKLINDSFSHAVGDQVLAIVGGLLRRCCRAGDIAARHGGDEFLLVLPGLTRQRAQDVLHRLRRRVRSFDWETIAPGLCPTMSIGVTAGPITDIRTLLNAADGEMYLAKKRGGNRINVADTLKRE